MANVLIVCEESQTTCLEFRKLGFNAFSCDILGCSGGHPEYHIKDNCLNVVNGRCEFITQDGKKHFIASTWDLIIAHPPCTYLSKAGACNLYDKNGNIKEDRYHLGVQAAEFFYSIANSDCLRICIENPTPIKMFGLPMHYTVVQPYLYDIFGIHPYTKRTQLWLLGLPPLYPTTPFNVPIASWTDLHSSSFMRSKSFKGISHAMADQWGWYLD